MRENRFNGKVAIVTGGASGIGEVTAKQFAEEGAKVVIVDINEQKANKVMKEILDNGGESCFIQSDITDEEKVKELVSAVRDTYGTIDILFNNAGTILPRRVEDIDVEEWRNLIDTNLTSMFLCIKYALPDLKTNQGKIINMGSMNGVVGQQNNPAYSASKGAIISMTRSLALDLAPFNVRVNAVSPAGVMTPLIEEWFNEQPDPEQMRHASDLSHMLGRTAEPEEIANVVLFLASAESSFITGQAIPVEGGATLGYGSGPKPEWRAFSSEEQNE